MKPRPAFDVDVSNGDERHAPRTHAAASRGTKGPCDSCAMWAHRGATSDGYTVDRNAHDGVRDRASDFASICPLVTRPRDVSPSLGDGQVRVRYSCLASWKHGGLDRDGEHADICTEDGVSSILVSLIALQIGIQCSVKRSRDDSCIYSFDKNELCMNKGNSIEINLLDLYRADSID